MSAPSPETSMQTPQREFAVQNYNKKMTYANKWGFFFEKTREEEHINVRA